MLEECLSGLNLKENGVYFDGTLGGAGHSYEILRRAKNSVLYATDLDEYGIARAKEKLKDFDGRFFIFHDNFKNFPEIAERENLGGFDGVLLDLGMSSFQIDDKSRGFSYLAENEPLDMRMNKEVSFTARDVINGYSEKDLARILKDYGEEKFASKIAKNIAEARKTKEITTCGELVGIEDQNDLLNLASAFYTSLTLDGRFVIKENNTWVLRDHELFANIHIDMNAVYAEDEDEDEEDEDEEKDDEDEDGIDRDEEDDLDLGDKTIIDPDDEDSDD